MTDEIRPSLLEPARHVTSEYRRADEMSRIAAGVGFDWESPVDALDKVEEEVEELRRAMAGSDRTEISHELGDVLFAVLNVARKAGLDPTSALKQTNDKFARRFATIEREVQVSGRDWADYSLDELEVIWQSAKNDERPT